MTITLDGNQSIYSMNLSFTGYDFFTFDQSGSTNTLTVGAGGINIGGLGQASVATTTFNNILAGVGGLTLNDCGTTILNGNNSYSGGTTINYGTLQLGSTGALGTSSTVTNNGTMVFACGGSFSQAINGTGSLQVNNGGGSLTLTGNNTFSGDTLLVYSTLVIGGVNALACSTLDTNNSPISKLSFGSQTAANFGGLKGGCGFSLQNDSGGAVALTIGANNQSNTLGGASGPGGLSGSGSFTKVGTGTETLTGALTYTGGTTVNGGTLIWNNTCDTSGPISIGPGATLEVTSNTGLAMDCNSTIINNGTFEISGAVGFSATVIQSPAGQFVADSLGLMYYINGLNITGGTLVNNGGIRGIGINHTFTFSNVTLAGTIPLGPVGDTIDSAPGTTFTICSTQGIIGWGTISAQLINNGSVQAYPGGPLSITGPVTNNGTMKAIVITNQGGGILNISSSVANNGTMEAVSGGTLNISSAVTQSSTGQIVSNGGVNVFLLNGSSVTGGLLNSTNGGRIIVPNGTNTVTFTDVTNQGYLGTYTNGSNILQLGGTSFTNDGTFWVDAGICRVIANVTVDGTGVMQMWNGASVDSPGGFTITNGSSQTILGNGTISAQLINNGLVSANSGPLSITVPVTNNGTMGAVSGSGGSLNIYRAVTQSSTGQIFSSGGVNVFLLNGSSVTGGMFNSANGGQIVIPNGTNTVTLTDVTNQGTLTTYYDSSDVLLLGGTTFTNNGGFGVCGGVARLIANIALGGAGTVYLSAGGSIDSPGGFTLTNGSSQTILGNGTISTQLINNGLVMATTKYYGDGPLSITGPVTNNGTMEAVPGGVLNIYSAVTQSASGQIVSNGGVNVFLLNGSSVTGGLLNSTNGGRIIVPNGTNTVTFTDVTNQGYLGTYTNGSNILQLGGTSFTNNGTFWVDAGICRVIANVTVAGTGVMQMWNGASIDSPGGFTLTIANGSSQTINGGGTMSAQLCNNGSFNANNTTLTITGSVANNGTIEATGGGYLNISGPLAQVSGTTLTGGTWIAGASSALHFTSSVGILTNQGSVTLDGSGSSFSNINSVNNNQGSFTVSGGRSFATAGALVNSGTVTVGANSAISLGSNLYTQTAGATVVNGSLSTNGVNVSGGVVQGTGTITGALTLSGTGGVSPGNGVGTLSVVGNILFGAVAADTPSYNWSLGASSNSLLAITGGLTVNASTVSLNVLNAGGTPNPANTYVLATYTGAAPAGIGNWVINHGSTGWRSGVVALDSADKEITLSGLELAGDVIHAGFVNSTNGAADIDAVYAHFGASCNSQWKVATDGLSVGQQDVTYLVQNILHSGYGDATLDGKVGIDDFSVLLAHWGSNSAGWADADFTGDRTVNIDDFSVLLSNWGWTSSSQSMAMQAPEPATLSLLALGGLALLRRRK